MSKNLNQAKSAKNDEFYTRLEDITKELQHYEHYFKGKTVYCNCDDPRVSGFFHYFSHQFKHLELKRLIATCYKSDNTDLFSSHDKDNAIMLDYKMSKNGRVPKFDEAKIRKLKGDGDFRSDECIKILQKADIVVTNPPFSLFREYVAQLVKYEKKFLIIGNMNAITYKETFPLIKENKLWIGVSIHSGDREFGVPAHYPLHGANTRIDDNGNKFVRVKGVRWFTNLTHKKRNEQLHLVKKYNTEEYSKYDNYNAINVDKVINIPRDYAGAMGVPITFMDKYNPEQFEIIGIDRVLMQEITGKVSRFRINNKELYARIIIKNKNPEKRKK